MILIHAADLHLGSPLGGLDRFAHVPVTTVRQAPMRAFERLAELCAVRSADVLVIAGDLFDGDADLATMRDAEQVLERITRAGTRVVTIRGNHDAASRMQRRMAARTGLEQLPVDRAGTVRYDELGIAVHGRGFDTQHVTDRIVLEYPPAIPGLLNVGLLHTSLEGDAKHAVYAPCSIDDLIAKGYQYWALGHVHKRTVHCEQPWILHAGNPQGRDVGELGPRGVTVVEYADGEVVGTPEHVDLDVVRWSRLELELDAEETAAELVTRAAVELESVVSGAPDLLHIVRVIVNGRGRAHGELATAAGHWREQLHAAALGVSASQLYLEQVKLRTRPALPDRTELMAQDDFIGDAARALLDPAVVEPTPLDADAFATLEKKVGQLPIEPGQVQLMPPLAAAELEASREALLGRLLEAHAADVEAAR